MKNGKQSETVKKTVKWLKSKTGGSSPSVAMIMGSGLSSAVPDMSGAVNIPYSEIPGFPRTTVTGHAGRLSFGKISGKDVAVMCGRFHYYEGHEMGALAFPIRVLGFLGVKTLIVTSAVGSIRTNLKPGDLLILKDHINMMGNNPLRGIYEKTFGDMFPDMSEPYDKALREEALKICAKLDICSTEGVYIANPGPSYETPAEIRAYRSMGADVVGMSVVPEVISARQMRIKVLCLSWITNFGSGVTKAMLSHPDVLIQGEKVAKKVKKLIELLMDSPLL